MKNLHFTMNQISRIFPLALLVIFVLACDDNRLDDIVDDQVYFLNPGVHHKKVFNVEQATAEVILIKNGIGKQGGTVTVAVNESLIDAYNLEHSTEYLPLPQDLFSIQQTDHRLEKDDYRVGVPIRMNGPAIRNLQIETGQTYVIPLQARVSAGELTASEPEKLETLMVPDIFDPYLSLSDTGLVSGRTVLNFDSPERMELFSSVQVNFANSRDIAFDIEIDADLVQQYNERHGTSFQVLGEDAYQVDNSTLTLRGFEDQHGFGLQILKDGFVNQDGSYRFGNYLIPIRLVAGGDIPIDPVRQTQLLQVSFQPNLLDRGSWEVPDWNSCICEEPQYDGLERVPENLLDGDPDTFWGSKWDEPKPFPYYLVFDMKQSHEVYQIELVKPSSDSWRGNLKSGYFEISDDGENWTRLGDWEMEENAIRSHLFSVSPQSGQYIKLVIEEAFNYFNPEVGIDSGANIDLSEFVVWGK